MLFGWVGTVQYSSAKRALIFLLLRVWEGRGRVLRKWARLLRIRTLMYLRTYIQ